MKNYYFNPFFNPNTIQPTTKLFSSLSQPHLDNLINNTYSHEEAMEWIEEMWGGDVEEGLTSIIKNIEETCEVIFIVNTLTGQILEEIPLTEETLGKTWEEAIPDIFSLYPAETGYVAH